MISPRKIIMIANLKVWIKQHLLAVILLGIIGILLLKQGPSGHFLNQKYSRGEYGVGVTAPGMGSMGRMGGVAQDYDADLAMPSEEISLPQPDVPPSDNSSRLIIRDTTTSLLVKDVPQAIAAIEQTATSLGGFFVDSHLNVPEESASGHITIRVPEAQRPAALQSFKTLAVKVISENVSGTDVTDQYEDIDAKLATLNQTKAKFEEILAQATRVQDTLQVQREIISLQTQIDSLRGRQQYLEKSANLSKITVYLSTDELALPYAPDQAWRPQLVFKQAVRSLLLNLRQIGNGAIWLVVYTPVLLVLLGLGYFFKRVLKKQG